MKFYNKIKFRGYWTIMTVGLIIALLLLNYFIITLDENLNLTLDMTSNRIYSLTSATLDVVDKLDTDIFIYTTETAGIEDKNIKEVLDNYASTSDMIHVVNIDIVKNPGAIEYYNELSDLTVTAGSVIVSNSYDTNDRGQRYQVLNYEDLYLYNSESQAYDELNAENKVTSAIKYITNPSEQRIWLLDNHTTNNAANSIIKEILENEHYRVDMLNILNGQNPLKKGDILIILSPESDLTPVERAILNDFLDDAGKLIVGIDPLINSITDLSNVISLTEKYNVKFGDGIIKETSLDKVAVSNDSEYVYSFIIPDIREHEITSEFLIGNHILLLGIDAGQLILPEKINDPDIKIEAVLSTSKTSYIEPWSSQMDNEPDNNAKYGEFTVMAAITDNGTDAKVIVLSAPGVFINAEAYSQNVYKNKDFLLKNILWLEDNESDIKISSKPLINSPLMIGTMKQAYFIIALVCVFIPLLIFGVGIIIFVKRNNL